MTEFVTVDPERDLPMSIAGPFVVALAGDIVQTKPITRSPDPQIRAAIDLIRGADLAVGNLEQAIVDSTAFRGHHYGVCSFLVSGGATIAADLAAAGFHVLARANNRLSDFGDAGNRETDDRVRAAGMIPVGFGEHLGEARRAACCDLPHGRIGVISVTSSFNRGQPEIFGAAARGGKSNGRPGANTLRVEREITLPPPAWDLLAALVEEADYAFPSDYPVQPTVLVYEDRIKVGANWYVRGEHAAYDYRMHADDVIDIAREVRETAAQTDCTIATLHAHQWSIDPDRPAGGMTGETDAPPGFVRDLAHAAIDNGADIFCVTGPFEFRAIEVYAGKPIFYGLGSFIRQAYRQAYIPDELYREFRFGAEIAPEIDPRTTPLTDSEIVTARAAKHPAHYFESAITRCVFEDSRLREIELHPIDLGFGGALTDLGTPRVATGDQATSILQAIAERCAAFSTELTIEGGIGHVRL